MHVMRAYGLYVCTYCVCSTSGHVNKSEQVGGMAHPSLQYYVMALNWYLATILRQFCKRALFLQYIFPLRVLVYLDKRSQIFQDFVSEEYSFPKSADFLQESPVCPTGFFSIKVLKVSSILVPTSSRRPK